jgi:hypothetical protein
MGGPVAPGMAAQEALMAPQSMAPQSMAPQSMPPQSMPPTQDPMMMAQQAQDMAAQQTQGLGAQYAQDTLMNIDRAETPEQIINALRGNEAPMEQRYAELAQFVGEADAQRTPESVLALVQPTIMMTEQGAMDSGIGELMQGLTGEIEMETAEGAPTAMGQGVGSLMMAGAPAAPEMGVGQQPVANFRQGGVVQRFKTGGEASRLQQLYSEMLPTYQSILGDGGEQRRLTQAQILFDIADRAGAFAAGVDPRTGQSIAGLSPAAQLAAATSGLGGQIGERMGSQEEQDRALRLAALQAAQGEFSAERAAARAAAAAGGSRGIGDAYEAVDAEGNVIATNFLATRADLEAFQAANPGATIRQARAPREPNIREFNNNLVDVSDPNNPITILEGVADRDIREVGGNLLDITDPLNPTIVYRGETDRDIRTVGSNLIDVTDPANPMLVYQGERDRDIRTVDGSVIDFTDRTNPVVLYRSAPDRDIREFGGNMIDITDPANPVVVMQGQPDRDIRTVEGRVIDFTDPANPAVLYEAPAEVDRDIREFGGNMIDITDPANPVVVMQGQPNREIRTVEGRVIDFTDPANPAVLYEPPAAAPSGEFINIQMPDESVRSVRADSPEADALIARGGTRVSATAARTADPLVDPDVMSAYAAGTLTPAEEARVQSLIAENTRMVFNPETGRNERPTVTPIVSQAERARRDAGLSTVITFPEDEPTIASVDEGLARLEQFGGAAFGTVAAATNFVNRLFALVDANAPFADQQEGINLVNTLNETATLAFRDMTAGRPAQDAVNQFATLSPATAAISGSPSAAASQIRALLDLWNREMAQSETALRSGILSQSDRAKVEAGIEASAGMIEAYQALLRGLERAGSGSGVDPAQFRR